MSSENERRYFYADRPSPLHDARDRYNDARHEAAQKANELKEEIGAESVVARGSQIAFTFATKPDESRWKYMSKDEKGNRSYLPKRNTKEGRELHKRMAAIKIPGLGSILDGTGLEIMRVHERYMLRTSVGWIGDRIFVTIPNEGQGDDFPTIPDYLTPCKRWEMEKYEDEYRASKEAPNEQ